MHVNSDVFTQVKREKHKAMNKSTRGVYEIFRIRIEPPTTLFGNELPEREHYPNSEEFGKIAWSTNNKERAEEIYNNLKILEKDGNV